MSTLLRQGSCSDLLPQYPRAHCIFADPPDNIDLKYDEYKDGLPPEVYRQWLAHWADLFVRSAETVWLSFNARWTIDVGKICCDLRDRYGVTTKPLVQVFTFGQHNPHDFGNNHRPLWRLQAPGAPVYPDQIRVESWRQRNGDKRANPAGRVPGDVCDMQYPVHPGDVLDFPRVTGNSAQRCDWHPTQLHEELVERAIASATPAGASVYDPFSGTGTVMRVCKKIGRHCLAMDVSRAYCEKSAAALGLREFAVGQWADV